MGCSSSAAVVEFRRSSSNNRESKSNGGLKETTASLKSKAVFLTPKAGLTTPTISRSTENLLGDSQRSLRLSANNKLSSSSKVSPSLSRSTAFVSRLSADKTEPERKELSRRISKKVLARPVQSRPPTSSGSRPHTGIVPNRRNTLFNIRTPKQSLGTEHVDTSLSSDSFRKLTADLDVSRSTRASKTSGIFDNLSKLDVVGVSIEFIRKFMLDHENMTHFSTFTTSDACSNIIIPACTPTKCAYIDLFAGKCDENGKPFLSKASVFVSHAWKYKLVEPVDVMEQYAEEVPDAYFWFDLFQNNQINAPNLPYDWWKTTFMETISSIGTVLLVLSPWNDPIPITRAWCLWEIMCALGQPSVEFFVLLPHNQADELMAGVVKSPRSIVQALADIQSEKADAYRQHDKEMIFQTIEETVGFAFVNQKVKDQLRDWYVDTLKAIADSAMEGDTLADARELSSIAFVLNAFGLSDDALAYNLRDLAITIDIRGPNHPDTAVSYNNIGAVYDNKGEYDKAIEYHSKALKIRVDILGEHNKDTANSYNNLGAAYMSKGDYDTAVDFYQKDLTITLEVEGPNHPDTATAYNNIGLALRKRGNFDKAIDYYEKSLKIRLATVGPKHPDTAIIYNNIGAVFDCKAEYVQAIKYYEKDLAICLEVLGDLHPDTASSFSNIGAAYGNMNKFDKALNFHEKSLNIRLQVLGDSHPETAQSYNNIAAVYHNMGQYDKAIEFYSKDLGVCLKGLGEVDPDTASAYNNIGLAYDRKGDFYKAIEYLDKALKIRLECHGVNNKDTADSYHNLGVAYLALKDAHEAKRCLSTALKIRWMVLGPEHANTLRTQQALVAVERI